MSIGLLLLTSALALTSSRVKRANRQEFHTGATQSSTAHQADSSPLNSILIQPFEGTSPDGSSDLFAIGATETAIAILAGIDGLSVYSVSTGSVPVTDVVLQGTVATNSTGASSGGDTVRLSGRLTRTNGELVWGQVYEGDQSQILLLQASLVTDAALQLGRTTAAPESWSRAVNPRAYQLYLAGREHLKVRRSESFHRAQSTFENALALDPKFAAAHAALAETYLLLGDYLSLPEESARTNAASHAQEALRLEPAGVEAAIASAKVALDGNWDFDQAEMLARRALSVAPGSSEALILLAEVLAYAGRFDEATLAADAAIAARPDSVLNRAIRAKLLLLSGNFEEAEKHFSEVLALRPAFGWPVRYRNYALERLGRREEAFASWISHVDSDSRFRDDQVAELQRMVDESGSEGHWNWRLQLHKQRVREGRIVHAAAVAEAYAGSDQGGQALAWLDQALEQRDDWLLDLLVSPAFDAVRGPDLNRRLAAHGIEHLGRQR